MNIDLGPFYKILNSNKQELNNIARKLRHAAENAANYEKQNHTYTNRTGNLEASTKGIVTKSGDEFEVSLVMEMEYASYVVARGFSQIDIAAKMMESDIENYLSRIGIQF